jgi:cell division protein FtsA
LGIHNITVGLDIGTTKTVVLVAEINSNDNFSIIGVGEQLTQGVKKGGIVDLEAVTKCINQALEKAEQMSGCHVQNVYLAVSGAHLSSMNNKGVVAITNKNREISVDDVDRVLQAAKVVPLPQDQKIIHIHPRQYTIDGNDGIIDPIGMAGTRLEAEINMVTASSNALTNLLRCVHKSGLLEEEFVPAPLASAEAVLFPAERELGCLVVDIGGGTTECAIFDQGRLWFTSVLPVGGNLITNDIAIGLRIPVEVAEVIKIEHGCVLSGLMPDNETFVVPDMVGRDTKKVSKKMLASIIEPRMREILSLIKNELKRSGYRGVLPGGMIITGGVAQLNGLMELAAEEMDLPIRIGYPDKINGVSETVRSSAYATAAGLVLYGVKNLAYAQAAPTGERFFGGIVSKVKHLFQDFFA